jgi:hypothetical protein
MSLIRFRDLVKAAGTPEPKSLWVDPKKDRDFMRAVKQNRVLTVVQGATRKDFGELGFHQHPNALYFVFPKRLPAEEGKVIGIKYDLADSREPADAMSPEQLKRVAKQGQVNSRESRKTEPVEKTFKVVVRRIAVLETALEINGVSKTEAKTKAAGLLKNRDFDLSNAKIEDEIRFVQQV